MYLRDVSGPDDPRTPDRTRCVVPALSPDTALWHHVGMDEIEPGELCPSCYEIPLDGDPGEVVECPNCGHRCLVTDDW